MLLHIGKKSMPFSSLNNEAVQEPDKNVTNV